MAISSTESPTAEPQSLASSPTQTSLANGVTDVACPPCDLNSDEPPLESYHHLQQLMPINYLGVTNAFGLVNAIPWSNNATPHSGEVWLPFILVSA
jgi:hypothetical protein